MWKPRSNSVSSSLPSFAIKGTVSGHTSPNQYSHIGPVMRVGGDSQLMSRDGRASTSSPLATSGIMHGSPVSDDSSLHLDSGIMNNCNGIGSHIRSKHWDNALYSQCVSAMCTLAKDPSPRIAGLGRRVLSIIGIEQVVVKSVKSSAGNTRPGESITSPINSLAGLARSSSWFDMNAVEDNGMLPATVRLLSRWPPICIWKKSCKELFFRWSRLQPLVPS